MLGATVTAYDIRTRTISYIPHYGRKHVFSSSYSPRIHRHEALVKSFSLPYFMALNAIHTSSPVLVHKTYFEFYTSPDAFDFSHVPARNRAVRGKLELVFAGKVIPISYEIYKSGFVIIKPRSSHAPMRPAMLETFMERIRAILPFPSPPVQGWKIAASDVHFDVPTLEKSKRYVRFNYLNTTFQCYNKTIEGERFLRLEAQIYPAVTQDYYPAAVEAARQKLLGVLGKN